MAYSLRADGLTDVHLPDGTVMPMALPPEQLEAMGHQRLEVPAMPRTQPDLRVAGPGGGDPRDLSGGAGIFGVPPSPQEENTRQLRDLLSRAPQSHESPPAQATKFDVPVPSGAGRSGTPELAAHSTPRGGAAEAQQGNDGLTLTPEQELAFREAVRGGAGGGGKPGLALGKRTEKYTTYGQVPKELSDDIDQRAEYLHQDQGVHLLDSFTAREELQNKRTAELQQQAADIADQRAQREQVNDRLQQLQQTRDQREQEVQTMPPADLHRYWGERGVASQVMTGLAIALGGYVQGLRGGENPGLKMANDSIDRWMSSERDKYDRAKDSATRANSQYGQALALYGTPEMAENDMRARAYAVRDSMLSNQLDQIGNADAYAKGQEALQQGALQRQQLKAQAMQMAGEKAVEDTLQMRQAGGGGGGGSFIKGLRAAAEATTLTNTISGKGGDAAKAAADARERQVRLPDGSIKYVPAASGRKDVQTAIDGRTDIISKLERLHQMQKNSNLVTDMTARAEYDSLAAAVKSQATVLAGQGAMSKGDEENITNGVPTSGVHMKDAAAALAQTIAGQRSSLNATIRGNVYDDPDAKRPSALSTSAPSSAKDVE